MIHRACRALLHYETSFHRHAGEPLARSIDGGKSFVNLPLPETPFDCCAATSFFGDYNGIDAYGGRVVALFPVVSAKPAAEQRVRAAIVRFRPGTQELQ